jgi:hypothetical protein
MRTLDRATDVRIRRRDSGVVTRGDRFALGFRLVAMNTALRYDALRELGHQRLDAVALGDVRRLGVDA